MLDGWVEIVLAVMTGLRPRGRTAEADEQIEWEGQDQNGHTRRHLRTVTGSAYRRIGGSGASDSVCGSPADYGLRKWSVVAVVNANPVRGTTSVGDVVRVCPTLDLSPASSTGPP
jgi:hypothetical protein